MNFHLGFAYAVLLLIAVCVVVIRVVDAFSAERAIIGHEEGQRPLAVRAVPNNKPVDDKCGHYGGADIKENHTLDELVSDVEH